MPDHKPQQRRLVRGVQRRTIPSLRAFIRRDDAIWCYGVVTLLQQHFSIELLEHSYREADLLARLKRLKPDFLICEFDQPQSASGDILPEIFRALPHMQILVLLRPPDAPCVRNLVEAGVAGCLLPSATPERWIQAVASAHDDRLYIDPDIGRILQDSELKRLAHPNTPSIDVLTPQERRVLTLLADGNSNKEIAHTTGSSIRTVENHRASLVKKLRIRSLAGLVKFAIRNCLSGV